MYLKTKGYKIEITKYLGWFGNNIIQMIHAIHIGKKTESKVVIKHHAHVNVDKLNMTLDFRRDKTKITNTLTKHWYSKDDLKPFLPPTTFETHQILTTIIYPFIIDSLKPSIEDAYILKDTVVIHIRSNDIFKLNSTVHPKYGQPPLSYYTSIIKSLNTSTPIKSILIVTEKDRRNPVISGLQEWIKKEYPTVYLTCQSSTFEEDVKALLSAQVLIVGNSTFTWILSLLSKNLKELHTPFLNHALNVSPTVLPNDFGVSPTDVGVLPFNVKVYSFEDYSPMIEWLNTPEQLLEMMTFPESKITRL